MGRIAGSEGIAYYTCALNKYQAVTVQMIKLDIHCMSGSVSSHKAVSIEIASSSPLEELWDELVQTHHYLGYRKLIGRRLNISPSLSKGRLRLCHGALQPENFM